MKRLTLELTAALLVAVATVQTVFGAETASEPARPILTETRSTAAPAIQTVDNLKQTAAPTNAGEPVSKRNSVEASQIVQPTPVEYPGVSPRAAANAIATSPPLSPTSQLSEPGPPGEELHELNFIVDVLVLLTTTLAVISGYTLFSSRREAAEARKATEATLAEARRASEQAQSALLEAKSNIEHCSEIRAKLHGVHTETEKELAAEKEGFELSIKTARSAFEVELRQIKVDLQETLGREKQQFSDKMGAEFELFRQRLHESTTINRTKTRLLELLSNASANPDDVFPLLTDILNYPDQRSFEIYERLLETFPTDEQIVGKVKEGLRIFRENHYVGSERKLGAE
jgi:hypothetical protein